MVDWEYNFFLESCLGWDLAVVLTGEVPIFVGVGFGFMGLGFALGLIFCTWYYGLGFWLGLGFGLVVGVGV